MTQSGLQDGPTPIAEGGAVGEIDDAIAMSASARDKIRTLRDEEGPGELYHCICVYG